jgi:Protein of unknown function (DUF3151)
MHHRRHLGLGSWCPGAAATPDVVILGSDVLPSAGTFWLRDSRREDDGGRAGVARCAEVWHQPRRNGKDAVMTDHSVQFTSGSGDTVLETEAQETLRRLNAALEEPEPQRRRAVAAVAARWPRSLMAWATLAELTDDEVERYAFARVGYHRGLDALRAAGWRGSGYVRWQEPTNRGFLRALEALRRAAEAIGERDEQERCALFLRQLDPTWPPNEVGLKPDPSVSDNAD